MLEPVARNQLSFRLAGLFQDGRGVVVGQSAVVVLLSIERVVSLIRLLCEELSLDDLLPTLRIELHRNPLGSTLYLVSFQSSDSLLLDRVSRLGRFLSAPLLVGTGKHFVAYRDEAAPLGYDVVEPQSDPADVTLYTQAMSQPCRRMRELSVADLVFQLQLLSLPGGVRRALVPEAGPDGTGMVAEPPQDMFVSCGSQLVPNLVRYLWQAGVRGELLLPDPLPPPDGLPNERTVRTPLLRLEAPPAALLLRLHDLPSVRLLRREGTNFLVELGFTHPLRLPSIQSLFPSSDLFLFPANQRGPLRARNPSRMPLSRLLQQRISLPGDPIEASQPLKPRLVASADSSPPPIKMTLQLIPQGGQPSRDRLTATLVPWSRLATLQRTLGLLSGESIFALQAVGLKQGLFCFGSDAVLHLCTGQIFEEVAPQLFVPMRSRLVPQLLPTQLRTLLGQTDDQLVVFLPPETQPIAVPRALATPLSLRLLSSLSSKVTETVGEPSALREPFPVLHCEPISFFSTLPLWGLSSEPEKQ